MIQSSSSKKASTTESRTIMIPSPLSSSRVKGTSGWSHRRANLAWSSRWILACRAAYAFTPSLAAASKPDQPSSACWSSVVVLCWSDGDKERLRWICCSSFHSHVAVGEVAPGLWINVGLGGRTILAHPIGGEFRITPTLFPSAWSRLGSCPRFPHPDNPPGVCYLTTLLHRLIPLHSRWIVLVMGGRRPL